MHISPTHDLVVRWSELLVLLRLRIHILHNLHQICNFYSLGGLR